MTTNEPLDSTTHSEPAPLNNLGPAEQAGQRFLQHDAPFATDPTPNPAVTSSTPPLSDPPGSPAVASELGSPRDLGAPSGYAPPAYAAESAPPVGYAPPPPAPAAQPPSVYPPPPATLPPLSQPVDAAAAVSSSERVGLGVLYSLGGVVLGVVATAALWQAGFIASITSAVMAWACIWLYTKGAGHAPRKGVFAVVGVIIAGVALSSAAVIATDAVDYVRSAVPGSSISDYVDTVVAALTTPEVWAEYATDIGMLLLFAALGTVGIIMQLARGNQTS